MFRGFSITFLTISLMSTVNCTNSPSLEEKQAPLIQNPLLSSWSDNYDSPDFQSMSLDQLRPAMHGAMDVYLAEVESISDKIEEPNFENTIVPLEKAGKAIDRVYAFYGIWSSNLSSPKFREIQSQLAPELSEFYSRIKQNSRLFSRIKSIFEKREISDLRPDQVRLVELVHDSFVRNGANLNSTDKDAFTRINKRLAELYSLFSNNVLADEEGYVTFLRHEELAGLPESYVAAAREAARTRGRPEDYAVTNTRSSMEPFLTYSELRELRRKVWNNYYSRASNGDERDNNKLISEILNLRHERSILLGYKSFAHWKLENNMALTPENAMGLLSSIWPAALKRVEDEVADMQYLADSEGSGITIAPWDYRFYAEKVRKQRFELDSDELRKYLQLDNLIQALFFVADKVFNYAFTPIEDDSVTVFHPDVRVWAVKDKASGKNIGLWYLDPFSREGKKSGAWATAYRRYSGLDEISSVLSSNNSNFIKGSPGAPTLVSWDDATTLFHEFGHALHYLSSNVTYPSLNGALRDYIEFQSQLLERWLMTDEVIDNFLIHYATGDPIPNRLVQQIKAAAKFNQGFETAEYLASALIDLHLHTSDPVDIDPVRFERDVLAALNMPSELVMRHRTPHFGHIFSGEGYAAGYYSYLWADVLTSDAAEAFAETPDGLYDLETAGRLKKFLFNPQNSIDPAEAYRLFRGRDAKVGALMRDRGFHSLSEFATPPE